MLHVNYTCVNTILFKIFSVSLPKGVITNLEKNRSMSLKHICWSAADNCNCIVSFCLTKYPALTLSLLETYFADSTDWISESKNKIAEVLVIGFKCFNCIEPPDMYFKHFRLLKAINFTYQETAQKKKYWLVFFLLWPIIDFFFFLQPKPIKRKKNLTKVIMVCFTKLNVHIETDNNVLC